jgi:hypothetical protein
VISPECDFNGQSIRCLRLVAYKSLTAGWHRLAGPFGRPEREAQYFFARINQTASGFKTRRLQHRLHKGKEVRSSDRCGTSVSFLTSSRHSRFKGCRFFRYSVYQGYQPFGENNNRRLRKVFKPTNKQDAHHFYPKKMSLLWALEGYRPSSQGKKVFLSRYRRLLNKGKCFPIDGCSTVFNRCCLGMDYDNHFYDWTKSHHAPMVVRKIFS